MGFSSKSTGVGCHFLLQEIFPTGSNPGLPHCRQTLYRLSHQGSPELSASVLKLQNSYNPIPISKPFYNGTLSPLALEAESIFPPFRFSLGSETCIVWHRAYCCCYCCCCCVTSVVSDSVRPYRQQPTRLPRPWDSPRKNTGVGCHFLLQCMKVKSESEVAQSCPTLSDPMDYSLPGSCIHGILQARVLEWGAIAFSDRAY